MVSISAGVFFHDILMLSPALGPLDYTGRASRLATVLVHRLLVLCLAQTAKAVRVRGMELTAAEASKVVRGCKLSDGM
jgi:hypothetical protein